MRILRVVERQAIRERIHTLGLLRWSKGNLLGLSKGRLSEKGFTHQGSQRCRKVVFQGCPKIGLERNNSHLRVLGLSKGSLLGMSKGILSYKEFTHQGSQGCQKVVFWGRRKVGFPRKDSHIRVLRVVERQSFRAVEIGFQRQTTHQGFQGCRRQSSRDVDRHPCIQIIHTLWFSWGVERQSFRAVKS